MHKINCTLSADVDAEAFRQRNVYVKTMEQKARGQNNVNSTS